MAVLALSPAARGLGRDPRSRRGRALEASWDRGRVGATAREAWGGVLEDVLGGGGEAGEGYSWGVRVLGAGGKRHWES